MSRRRSRSRYSGPSYTARLQQRTANRPGQQSSMTSGGGRLGAVGARVGGLPAAGHLAWLAAGWPPAALMLLAEAGHLAATIVEWPAAAPRGVFHVLAAAVLGFVAVSGYFGASRVKLGLGLGAGLVLPACWLVGALVGLSPYREFPVLAAVGVTVIEVVAAALATVHWQASRSSSQPAVRGGERAGEKRGLPQRARA